jgi:hypothetical protein
MIINDWSHSTQNFNITRCESEFLGSIFEISINFIGLKSELGKEGNNRLSSCSRMNYKNKSYGRDRTFRQ